MKLLVTVDSVVSSQGPEEHSRGLKYNAAKPLSNPKHEIRNKCKFRMMEFQKALDVSFSVIQISCFEFVSDFEI